MPEPPAAAGFCRAHEELGRPLEAGPALCRHPRLERRRLSEVRRPGRGRWSAGDEADAILADNDLGAALLIRALMDLGLRVPEDVAVIGWGERYRVALYQSHLDHRGLWPAEDHGSRLGHHG